jgi:hypothetical protein
MPREKNGAIMDAQLKDPVLEHILVISAVGFYLKKRQ